MAVSGAQIWCRAMVFWSGVFSILFLKFNSKSFVWFLGGLHTENQNCHIVCKSVWNRRWVNIVSFFGNKNLATWPWVLLKFQVALILCGLTGNRAKHFLGLIVELLPWLFSFTFSLSHLLFSLIFFIFLTCTWGSYLWERFGENF